MDGQFPYFHIDNCDFTIDTPDGKNQLHGALIVLFQRKVNQTSTYSIADLDMNSRTCKINPTAFTDVQECEAPNVKKMFRLPDTFATPLRSDDRQALLDINGELPYFGLLLLSYCYINLRQLGNALAG